MNELQAIVRLSIHDGKSDLFKTAAQACMDLVREKGAGVVQYDWFFNDDRTECIVLERYVDSDALLAHGANIAEPLGTLHAISDVSANVLGTSSSALMSALEGMDVTFYELFQGL